MGGLRAPARPARLSHLFMESSDFVLVKCTDGYLRAVGVRDEPTAGTHHGTQEYTRLSPDEEDTMKTETLEQATGLPVYAADGEKVGDVEAVFHDKATGQPEWLAVATGLLARKRLLVPVSSADMRDDRIDVPYGAGEIQATPEVEGDDVSQETERALYSHYGIPYSEQKSPSGLPADRSREGRLAAPSASRAEPLRRAGSAGSDATRKELYEEARRLDIPGRSKMNKQQLARAVGRAGGRREQRPGDETAKANPIEVQKFLEGVRYPTERHDLVAEAGRQGASNEVRSTLERLPDERFETPTDVSEAIGKLS
jgi:Protein of unknown function (DUF2795)/PRC-barrel domain